MSAFNDFTVLLLLCHFLGDYQFQPESLSQKKNQKMSGMLIHFGIHFVLLALLAIWAVHQGLGIGAIFAPLAVFGVHVVLDVLKRLISKATDKKPGYKARVALYIADQVLHIGAILLFSQVVFATLTTEFALGSFFTREMLHWALLLIVVTKPANVSFKQIFEKYQYKEFDEAEDEAKVADKLEKKGDLQRMDVGIEADKANISAKDAKEPAEILKTIPGAGATIGTLERILSAIFLAAGQWTALGMIFTAKSVARFKQIEKNKQFAEYYLIGTLYSILFVVVAFYLIMKL